MKKTVVFTHYANGVLKSIECRCYATIEEIKDLCVNHYLLQKDEKGRLYFGVGIHARYRENGDLAWEEILDNMGRLVKYTNAIMEDLPIQVKHYNDNGDICRKYDLKIIE